MKKFGRKTVYIYEINGQEKISVTSEKEALHWDAVFEVAEQVDQLLQDEPPELKLDETQRTDLSLYLAEHRNEMLKALSAGEVPELPRAEPSDSAIEKDKLSSQKKPDDPVKKQKFVQEFKRPVEPSKDGFSL